MPGQQFYDLLTDTLKDNSKSIDQIREDIHAIKVDVEILKDRQDSPVSHNQPPRVRLKDSAAGGTMGAFLTALIMAVMDYFQRH